MNELHQPAASPTLWPYSLKEVISTQKKIKDTVLLHYAYCRPSGTVFDDFLQMIAEALPKTVPGYALRESLRQVAGVDLTDEVVDELSWRLAGNIRTLRVGTPTPPWSGQKAQEWAPVQVMEAEPGRLLVTTRAGGGKVGKPVEKLGVCLRLFVMAGSPAGKTVPKFWSTAYAQFVKTELGFSRYDRLRYKNDDPNLRNFPFRDVRELTRLRFYALFDPESSREGPDFAEIKGTQASLAWNRGLMQNRRRLGFACPLEYNVRDVPCCRCEAGYDQCRAGCHPVTYVRRVCPSCRQESWFDPSKLAELCVDCSERRS